MSDQGQAAGDDAAARWRVGAIGDPLTPVVVKDPDEPLVRRVPVYVTPRRETAAATARTCRQPGAGWTWLLVDHDTPAPDAVAHDGAVIAVESPAQGVAVVGEWPSPALGWPPVVVVVCRPRPDSVAAAAQLIGTWAADQAPDRVEVLALVVTHPIKPRRADRKAAAASAHDVTALAGAVGEVLEHHPHTAGDTAAIQQRIETLLHLSTPTP